MKTKTELLSEMRELQAAYSKASTELKALTAVEEKAQREARQLERLEIYKAQYKFYVTPEGEAKAIDWEEVEKLIRGSFDLPVGQGGYALGYDATGMEGLGQDYGNAGTFTPMVEEESDVRKFVVREKRRQEYLAKIKKA